MKVLLKALVNEEVVTIFQVSTMTILENSKLPENTRTNSEIGEFIEHLIANSAWAKAILDSSMVLEQTVEMAWVRQAVEQGRDERGLRNCIRGIRLNNLKQAMKEE